MSQLLSPRSFARSRLIQRYWGAYLVVWYACRRVWDWCSLLGEDLTGSPPVSLEQLPFRLQPSLQILSVSAATLNVNLECAQLDFFARRIAVEGLCFARHWRGLLLCGPGHDLPTFVLRLDHPHTPAHVSAGRWGKKVRTATLIFFPAR